MENKPTKIGMIGAGFISNYHISSLQAAGADVTGIFSQNIENARRQALRYGIPNYTSDYGDILSRADVQAVVIVTPDFTHKDITLDALASGKAVLLQKPMAINSGECRELISASERNGTPLYVSFMHRYFEEVDQAHHFLKEKALGRILSVRQRNATAGASWANWFYDKDKVGGGVVMQLGVHGIDLLRYLFGEIEAVNATTNLLIKERVLDDGRKVEPNNEDFAVITYRFSSGIVGVHEAVYNEAAGTDRFRMEIYGEKGTVWLRSERGRLAIYAPVYLGSQGWFSPSLPEPNFGYKQHKHFLDMLTGKSPDDGSAKDGLISTLIAEAIYRSAQKTDWEKVEQV